jgi:predicted transcriptional regulator
MMPRLTPEQREALDRSTGPVPVEDAESHRVYFLIDSSTFDALKRQQDLDAIREGIADMEAGRVAPLDEVMTRIRASLGQSPT